jgi:hypothetical protein
VIAETAWQCQCHFHILAALLNKSFRWFFGKLIEEQVKTFFVAKRSNYNLKHQKLINWRPFGLTQLDNYDFQILTSEQKK